MTPSLAPCAILTASTLASIRLIAAEEWNACVGPADAPVSHANLSAPETAGIATPEVGFTPCHAVLRDAGGRVAAVAPTYLKTHWQGELGVDRGLPMAHGGAAGRCYPKLQVEVPMGPFAGQCLLARPGVDRTAAISARAAALRDRTRACGAASVQISHMTARPGDLQALRDPDYAIVEGNT